MAGPAPRVQYITGAVGVTCMHAVTLYSVGHAEAVSVESGDLCGLGVDACVYRCGPPYSYHVASAAVWQGWTERHTMALDGVSVCEVCHWWSVFEPQRYAGRPIYHQ